jgi:hypothetical protein
MNASSVSCEAADQASVGVRGDCRAILVTTMVSRVVVSEYSTDPKDGEGRQYVDVLGPHYDLNRVIQMVSDPSAVRLWTRDCIRDVGNLYEQVRDRFDTQEEMVAAYICELPAKGTYLNTEWCKNNGNALAACDAYSLKRMEFIPHAKREMLIEYYVKFAINKAGKFLLVAGCHPPRSRA